MSGEEADTPHWRLYALYWTFGSEGTLASLLQITFLPYCAVPVYDHNRRHDQANFTPLIYIPFNPNTLKADCSTPEDVHNAKTQCIYRLIQNLSQLLLLHRRKSIWENDIPPNY